MADLEPSNAAERLIRTAEQLIGERGLEAVSAREISRAAGQKNNYAVQYHFGDFAGLIRALQQLRMPEVERRRADMLERARRDGRLGKVATLTAVLYRPLLDLLSPEGERRYARFVLAMLSSPHVERHADGLVEAMPAAIATLELIHRLHPELPLPLIYERQRLIAILVLTSVFNRRPPYDQPGNDAAAIENALAMASAALIAPVGPALAAVIAP